MLDRGSTAPRNHAQLSDLISVSSEERFGGGRGEPANTTPTEIFGSGGLAFAADGEGGSGASTPPLWDGSESPENCRRNRDPLSPGSRIDAILRGRVELMEMVKNMPESCYELSLRDLVEVNRSFAQEGVLLPEGQKGQVGSHKPPQSQQHRQQMVRSGSLDNSSSSGGGFLLKMMFPVPWRAGKKRKGAKMGRSDASARAGEEWWKKRSASVSSATRGGDSTESSGESGSLNGRSQKISSSNWSSCSSSGSSTRQESNTDCWSFIRARARAGR
ncbi:hypothetical protein SAY86_020776 [Trapa natans]|uniref:Uncharacterized protein n=1 Tax=Trapa natans TaxID=22666 RepID=A0AAN7M7F9_TRANT|nr:hypothetical protein SAY86_020776 [Trapa natans]